jgi:Sulfotransferase family
VATVPFVFVVGCGRSGTTLLRAMLDSHPDLAIPTGSGFIPPLLRTRGELERDGAIDADHYLDMIQETRFKRWELDAEVVRSALIAAAPGTVEDAIRATYRAYARDRGKRRYGDKTHGYVLHISAIAQAFPESRFVHIVRDGRDAALSLKEAPFGPSEITPAARFWRRRVEEGRRAGNRLGPARYREVRYERLVEDPEGELRPLSAFLDLAFEPSMLRYFERASDVARGLVHPEIHRRISAPPSKQRDWRAQMDPEQVKAFEMVAGPTLLRFGYERGTYLGSGLEAQLRWTDSKRRTRRVLGRAVDRIPSRSVR